MRTILASVHRHSYNMRLVTHDCNDSRTTMNVRNAILHMDKRNVVYMGYIGFGSGQDLYKFGISRSIAQRCKAHEKTFGKFDLCYLAEYDRNYVVENAFANMVKSRGLLIDRYMSKVTSTRQREVIGLHRDSGLMFTDLAIDMNSLVLADSMKHTHTHRGSILIREALFLD